MAEKENGRLKVAVDCDFDVDASTVFNAWLDPAMLSQWMFGKSVRYEEIVKLENNPVEGGRFSYVVQRGDETLNHTGKYLEIQPYTRLVFTWGIGEEAGSESTVYIAIQPQGKGCSLSLTHEMDPKWESYASRTKDGWTYMLGKLKALCNAG